MAGGHNLMCSLRRQMSWPATVANMELSSRHLVNLVNLVLWRVCRFVVQLLQLSALGSGGSRSCTVLWETRKTGVSIPIC